MTALAGPQFVFTASPERVDPAAHLSDPFRRGIAHLRDGSAHLISLDTLNQFGEQPILGRSGSRRVIQEGRHLLQVVFATAPIAHVIDRVGSMFRRARLAGSMIGLFARALAASTALIVPPLEASRSRLLSLGRLAGGGFFFVSRMAWHGAAP